MTAGNEGERRLAEALGLHREAQRLDAERHATIARRNNAIRAAIAGGVSAYRVARELGLNQSLIGRIRHGDTHHTAGAD